MKINNSDNIYDIIPVFYVIFNLSSNTDKNCLQIAVFIEAFAIFFFTNFISCEFEGQQLVNIIICNSIAQRSINRMRTMRSATILWYIIINNYNTLRT